LKIKSYYAKTVEEALGQASGEMGPDAVLVHSRRTPVESRHLGPYEVVFAVPAKTAAGPRANGEGRKAEGRRNDAADAGKGSDMQLSLELLQMRRQMEEIRRALAQRNQPAPAAAEPEPAWERVRTLLTEAGVDAEIAADIANEAAAAYPTGAEAPDDDELFAALQPLLVRRLRGTSDLRPRTEGARIVAFAGPPGGGKTTALVKLACAQSQAAARSVHLISADTYRIGACEQLKGYASILGVGLDFADTPALLSQSIEAARHKELVLIDMPGLSGPDFELVEAMLDFLGRRQDIEKHFVVPATARFRDLKRSLRQYERFRPDCLLFTHLDETDCFGSIYSTAVWSGTPVSYVSAGQLIPEDLEEAAPAQVVELVLGRTSRANGRT
jgi:flagellar biosynthesis protein FlhF